MTDKATALRRLDRTAGLAMLLAGLGAQAAMWTASHRGFYLVAIAASLAVASTRRVPDAALAAIPQGGRLACRAVRVVSGVALVAACGMGVVGAGLRDGRPPSTASAVGALLVMAHLAHASTVRSRRDAAAGGPLVAMMLLQAAFATHDARLAVPFAVALCGGVAGLAAIHRAELIARVGVVVSGGRSVLHLALVRLAGVAILAALVLALLPNSAQLSVSLAGRNDSASSASDRASVHAQVLADPATHSLDLRVRGPLSGDAVFVTTSTAPAYWQGAVYDHYDGTTWTTTAVQPAVPWTASAQDGVTVQSAPVAMQADVGSAGVSRTDSVRVVSPSPMNVVFAPGRATSYTGPGNAVADGNGNVTLTGPLASAARYRVTSVQPGASIQSVATATGADPTDQRWLQLPANLPTRVSQLAEQVAGQQATRAATVKAVETYLRSTETYDLSAPVPAPGTDAVDAFLFASHQGFCEQFASAAVVMLRVLGIPARLVTGYAHGDTGSDPGTMVMRESDAHAWVQVWYPGIGWIDSDPTAGAALAAPAAGASAGGAAPSVSHAAAHKRWSMFRAAVAFVGTVAGDRRGLAGTAAVLVVLVLAIGGGVTSVFVRRRRVSPPTPALSANESGDHPGPVLNAYLRFADELCDRGREAGETIRECAQRLTNDAPITARLDVALELLERECYGGDPLSRGDADRAVATFDEWTSATRRNGRVVDLGTPTHDRPLTLAAVPI